MPKLDRFTLGQKIDGLFTDVIEYILIAGFTTRVNKSAFVQKASVKLDTLKFFLQLAWSLKAIDDRKLAAISNPLFEIGKMLGGWQRQLTKETPLTNLRGE